MKCSRINEWYHDISGSIGDSQAFMVVSEPTRMHETPSNSRLSHTAIVAHKPTSSTLLLHNIHIDISNKVHLVLYSCVIAITSLLLVCLLIYFIRK